MPLKKGKSQKAVSSNIKAEIKARYPRKLPIVPVLDWADLAKIIYSIRNASVPKWETL